MGLPCDWVELFRPFRPPASILRSRPIACASNCETCWRDSPTRRPTSTFQRDWVRAQRPR